jgi:hypothetical protein
LANAQWSEVSSLVPKALYRWRAQEAAAPQSQVLRAGDSGP